MGFSERLEGLSLLIGVAVEELHGDVKNLAWDWELLFWKTHSHSAYILHGLVDAYLRGRGFRTRNIQGYKRHGSKLSMLCTTVIEYVVEKGQLLFPTLHEYGYNSLENACKLLDKEAGPKQKDILAIAEEILKKKKQ
jgi:hypothetical protein